MRTVGCRLNQAESAQIAAAFQAAGCVMVPPDDPCDVFIVHSCTITNNAASGSNRLARAASRREPRPIVVLAGCAVEVGDADIAERAQADLIVGQGEKFDLPALLAAQFGLPMLAAAAQGDTPPPLPFFTSTRPIVRIQDGCRFGCSYCIVPQTRSQLWSRPLAETVDEVNRLGQAGYREVVLTGANLGCYRDGGTGLTELLTVLLRDTGVERIRLSSIESATISDDLVALMAGNERICRYLHIPLQSGDDGILAAMRRRYRSADFRALVERLNTAMPGIGIGTDIITGFPGESDDAFAQTRRCVEELPFSNLHVFPYSARPGTDAATMTPLVDGAVARSRAAELIALGKSKREAFAQRLIGSNVALLVEKCIDGTGQGWTSEYLPARVSRVGIAEGQIVTFQPVAWQAESLV